MQTTAFLRQHGLDALSTRYAIKATRGKAFPNLVHLKYRQLDADMSQPIVQECRGLIVDEADDWRVACRAFDKFFNSHQPHAAAIDWPTATVYEKLDGSLMTLYWYRGGWRVSSSGIPDASGPVEGGTTFADLFWQTWKQLGYRLPSEEHSHGCFVFELMTPLNRIIVQHAQPRLVLIGIRWLHDMSESAPQDAGAFGWECVRSFPIRCMDDCIAAAKELNPLQAEGYVVRDAQFHRIKVKCPQYVALAHLKDGMSGRRLLELVRANETDEFLSYFPEWTGPCGKVRGAFEALCSELETAYQTIRHIPEQKAFAAEALKTRCAAPLFALRKGDCKTVAEYFRECTFQSLERVIGIDLMTIGCQSVEP